MIERIEIYASKTFTSKIIEQYIKMRTEQNVTENNGRLRSLWKLVSRHF